MCLSLLCGHSREVVMHIGEEEGDGRMKDEKRGEVRRYKGEGNRNIKAER